MAWLHASSPPPLPNVPKMFRALFFRSPLPKEKEMALFTFLDFFCLTCAILASQLPRPSGNDILRSCQGQGVPPGVVFVCCGLLVGLLLELLLPFAHRLVVAKELGGRRRSGLDTGMIRLFFKIRNLLNAFVLVSVIVSFAVVGGVTTDSFRLLAWEESVCLCPFSDEVAVFLCAQTREAAVSKVPLAT